MTLIHDFFQLSELSIVLREFKLRNEPVKCFAIIYFQRSKGITNNHDSIVTLRVSVFYFNKSFCVCGHNNSYALIKNL
jgi:hypothetical protein